MRKICVVTGTRAEYGLLHRLMRRIADDENTTLQIIATNMHLSKQYGYTLSEIESDGFHIDKLVPILSENTNDIQDTISATSKALVGIGNAYRELDPDIILLLGDRYEILAAAIAGLLQKMVIAHISGGSVTEGAYDDAMRHSITKMSHLHFVSTETYRKRVIQLGEEPERVFDFGTIGIDNIRHTTLLTKKELENSLNGFKVDRNTVMVTYHPVTLSCNSAKHDIEELLKALDESKDLRIVFTMPNSDSGSVDISTSILRYVQEHPTRACCFASLGNQRYLSLMQYIGGVVGNSSSGITETPSFNIPTLNIGTRQKGRIMAQSVRNCEPSYADISKNLKYMMSKEFQDFCKKIQNPYEKPDTMENIFKVLSTYPLENLIPKHFYDL